MRNVRWRARVVFGVLLLSACGDDSAAAGDATMTGVPAGTVTEDLGMEEAERFCDSFAAETALFEDAEVRCLEDGVAGGENTAECERIRDACIDDIQPEDAPGDCDAAELLENFTGCKATVAELEACITIWANELRALSCDEPGRPRGEPDCIHELLERCPNLGDNGDNGDSGDGGGGGGGAGSGTGDGDGDGDSDAAGMGTGDGDGDGAGTGTGDGAGTGTGDGNGGATQAQAGQIEVTVDHITDSVGKVLVVMAMARQGNTPLASFCSQITESPAIITGVLREWTGTDPCDDSGDIMRFEPDTYGLNASVFVAGSMQPDLCATFDGIVNGDLKITAPRLDLCGR